jgi:ATP-dependent exoDNAse (exonuclease V) alpha subunit
MGWTGTRRFLQSNLIYTGITRGKRLLIRQT